MKKAGIIGATGYAGVELVRLLLSHPDVEIGAISSVSFEGKSISEIYPNLLDILDTALLTEQEVIDRCDIIFAAVPHGLSQELARKCKTGGKLFIDLGADFRLYEEADYKQWYKGEYVYPELHREAVYALPELYEEKIASAKVIGNPGCYPTTVALGLAPMLKKKAIDPDTIIIDSKSGVTGAGRGLTQNTHYPDCNEAFSPYKIAEHRHTPEIEQTLSDLYGEKVTVTFVPHLLPVNRGIESTIYAKLVENFSIEEILESYKAFYKDKKFVRILPRGQIANIKNVRCSNYCDISLHLDARTRRLIVVSCIDNMVKGAAGQAIQNMNIAMGFAQDAGLCLIPPAF